MPKLKRIETTALDAQRKLLVSVRPQYQTGGRNDMSRLGTFLGIYKTSRRAARSDVAGVLTAMAELMPKDKELLGLMEEALQMQRRLHTDPANDTLRERQLNDWRAIRAKIEQLFNTMEAAKKTPKPGIDGSVNAPSPADLLKRVELLRTSLSDNRATLGKFMQPIPAISLLGLEGDTSELQRRAAEAEKVKTIDPAQLNLISNGITGVKDRITFALKSAGEQELKFAEYMQELELIRKKTAELTQLLGTPFKGQLASLQGSIEALVVQPLLKNTPLSKLGEIVLKAKTERLRLEATKIEEITQQNGKDSEQDYLRRFREALDASKVFDMLRGQVPSRLSVLQDNGSPAHAELYKTYQQKLAALKTPPPDKPVDDLVKYVEQDFGALLVEINTAVDEVEKELVDQANALADRLTDFGKRFVMLKEKLKGFPAAAGELRQTEGLMGGARVFIPENRRYSPNQSQADIEMATKMTGTVEKQIIELEKPTAETKLKEFDQRLKAIAVQLQPQGFFESLFGRTAQASKNHEHMLATYDPEKRKELDGTRAKLLNKLPQMTVEAATKELDALRLETDKAVDTLIDTEFMIKGAKQLQESFVPYLLQKGVPRDYLLSTKESTYHQKDAALTKLYAVQPPDAKAIKATLDDLQETVYKITSEQDFDDDVKGNIRLTKETEANNKRLTLDYEHRMILVDSHYEIAKGAVDKLKGDANALKSADRLRQEVRADIKSAAFGDKLDKRIELLDQRLMLLINNPLGETARKIDGLDALIDELDKATETLASAADTAGKQVATLPAADDETRTAVTKAGLLLESFGAGQGQKVGAQLRQAAAPLLAKQSPGADAKLKAREAALRMVRDQRAGIRRHPLTAQVLQAPLPELRNTVAPVFLKLDQLEYTLATCI